MNVEGKWKDAIVVDRHIDCVWDDQLGRNVYQLVVTKRFWGHATKIRRCGWFGPLVEHRVNGEPRDIPLIDGRGDRAWALRVAKHYQIKVPKDN